MRVYSFSFIVDWEEESKLSVVDGDEVREAGAANESKSKVEIEDSLQKGRQINHIILIKKGIQQKTWT